MVTSKTLSMHVDIQSGIRTIGYRYVARYIIIPNECIVLSVTGYGLDNSECVHAHTNTQCFV